ncbi:MAG: hypothetical protein Q9227_008196 [Pyrenula ochraceoflavens]
MSKILKPFPDELPFLQVDVSSDINVFRVEIERLAIPPTSTFTDFVRLVAENYWVRHVIKTTKNLSYKRPLAEDDGVYPFKDDVATPKGGCPYYEWLKMWNNLLRPTQAEGIEAGWFKDIQQNTWRAIEKDYYKGCNIGNDQTKEFGRSMDDFNKAQSQGSTYDTPDKGWLYRRFRPTAGSLNVLDGLSKEWNEIVSDKDWTTLMQALREDSKLRVLFVHHSTRNRLNILHRREKMEDAIRRAGGMVPIANVEDLPRLR